MIRDTGVAEDSAVEDTGVTDTGDAAITDAGDTGVSDTGADSGPAPTPTTGVAAYVWANDAASPSYTPPAAFSYNSSGGAIGITRSATGKYTVTFGGLTLSSGDIQVTSYGSDARCAVSSWSGTAGTVDVVCRAPGGGLVDSMFMLAVIQADVVTNARVVAYATANQPTAASYVPEATRRYAAGGGTITATRVDTGVYSMTFAGLTLSSGDVQVTAVGSDTTSCSIWGVTGSKVDVRCHRKVATPDGAVWGATDSAYSVSVIMNGVASAAKIYGYVLTKDGTASHSPDPAYSFNTSKGSTVVLYGAVGRYVVGFANHAGVGTAGSIEVTSFDSTTHCKASNWTEDLTWGTGEFDVDVQCYDWAGAPANSRFMVLWVK